jgi:hypothetical protein
MLKDKKVAIAVSFAYFLCWYLVYIFYSPIVTIRVIENALKQKNVELLDDYIDFNSIQHSVISQLKTDLILKATEKKELKGISDPLFIANVSSSNKMIEDFIKLFLSKNGFFRLFEMSESNLDTPNTIHARNFISSLQSESFIKDDSIYLRSFRSIEVNGYNKSGLQHKFILTFRYYRWVLTDFIIDLHEVEDKKVIKFISHFNKLELR